MNEFKAGEIVNLTEKRWSIPKRASSWWAIGATSSKIKQKINLLNQNDIKATLESVETPFMCLNYAFFIDEESSRLVWPIKIK